MELQYHEAATVDEAVKLLSRPGRHPAIVAGGTEVTRGLTRQTESPDLLVGIKRIAGLRDIVMSDSVLSIGTCVTLADVARSESVRAAAPTLALAAGMTYTPQIRNQATLGGSLLSSPPWSEVAVALLASDAELEVVGPDGTRRLSSVGLLAAPDSHSLDPGEIVTRVIVTSEPEGIRHGYSRVSRRGVVEPPLSCSAVELAFGDGRCVGARVAVGSGVWPTRLDSVESFLIGKHVDAELAADATDQIRMPALRHDVRATQSYVERMIRVAVLRALRQAIDGDARRIPS